MRTSLLIALGGLLLLAGCADDAPPVRVGYDLPPKVTLDVLTVSVQDRSGAYGTPPQADGVNFQPTVANAIKQYVNDKLGAVGSTGEAVVTIKDASVKLENIPYTPHTFSRPQAARYVAHADVEIKVRGREGFGQVEGQASRFETLLQDPTPAERQNAYNSVLNGLMHDLAVNLDNGIHEHLANFIITAPAMDSPAGEPLPLEAPYTYSAH